MSTSPTARPSTPSLLALSLGSAVAGAASGAFATLPMTVTMEALFRRLPRDERYSLPPSELVMETVECGVLGHRLPRRPHTALTLAAHFSYGTAMGTVVGPLARRLPLPAVASGAATGVALWAWGYLVALPAVGLLRPATSWPARRNALMIAAHVVWGVGLRLAMGALERPDAAGGDAGQSR
jgi:hypothetical protein